MVKKSKMLWRQVLLYSLVFFVFILGLIYLAWVNLRDVSGSYISMSQYSRTGTAMLQTDIFLDSMLRTATQVSHDTEVISTMRQLHADSEDGNRFLNDRQARETMAEILNSHNTADIPVHRISVYDTTGSYACTDSDPDTLRLGRDATCRPDFIATLDSFSEAEYFFIGPRPDPYSGDPEEYFS